MKKRCARVLITVLVPVFAFSGIVIHAQDTEGRLREGILAPPIPAREAQLDLFVREISGRAAVRILRYGRRGSLRRPDALDLPGLGRAFMLHSYDLLAPVDRAVEVRRMPGYRGWLEFSPGSYAVAISERSFEFLHGEVRWDTAEDDTPELIVSAGPLAVIGRGAARIERRPDGRADTVQVEVLRGRFEILRGEELLAALGAGQTRRLVIEDAPVDWNLTARREHMARVLEDATLRLYQGPLTGNTLSQLWDAVLLLGPIYAHAEAQSLPGVPDPDLALRSMGDALRLLAAFSFMPAGTGGM